MTPENLLQLISDDHKDMSKDDKTSYLQEIQSAMSSSAGLSHIVSGSCLWVPIDLVLEDAMDGTQVDTTSSIEIVTRNANSVLVFPRKKRIISKNITKIRTMPTFYRPCKSTSRLKRNYLA